MKKGRVAKAPQHRIEYSLTLSLSIQVFISFITVASNKYLYIYSLSFLMVIIELNNPHNS